MQADDNGYCLGIQMPRPRCASSVAQSHINPLSIPNMIPKSIPARFPLAAATGSSMLGMFLKPLIA